MFWVDRSSAFAATRFGFRPRFFGDVGVAVGPSSTNCDGASLVFGVGVFLRLVRVFVFSDRIDTSMATDFGFSGGRHWGNGSVKDWIRVRMQVQLTGSLKCGDHGLSCLNFTPILQYGML